MLKLRMFRRSLWASMGTTLWCSGPSLPLEGFPYFRFLRRNIGLIPLDVLHQGVINGAYEVIKLKGVFHGIEEEVFLSLPAFLGRGGVLGIVEIPLTPHEIERLLHSANTILQVQRELVI
ncbi:hypothetical protein SUGI_0782760 [Cryptomeria japonica]|nr:hypothetical protein SUGI_0782760 [Cryptomeria japonica]